jgi:hypothetical protein
MEPWDFRAMKNQPPKGAAEMLDGRFRRPLGRLMRAIPPPLSGAAIAPPPVPTVPLRVTVGYIPSPAFGGLKKGLPPPAPALASHCGTERGMAVPAMSCHVRALQSHSWVKTSRLFVPPDDTQPTAPSSVLLRVPLRHN